MARNLFIAFVLFLTPFAVYTLYRWRMGRPVTFAQLVGSSTIVWLTAFGAALGTAGVIAFSSSETLPARGRYVPDRYENGVFIPGHVVPEDEGSQERR